MHSNNVFQYSKIRTRKRNAKKSIKTVKNWNPALFGIRNPVPGIRNPQRGIQNPRMSWIPLHGAMGQQWSKGAAARGKEGVPYHMLVQSPPLTL